MQIIVKLESQESVQDWAIIELQGDLETRNGKVQMDSKFIGDLHYTKSGDNPIMIIGHHILHGKIQDLEKPFVFIEKQTQNQVQNDLMEVDDLTTEGSGNVYYRVKAVVRKKLVFKTRPKPIIANVPKKIKL